LASDSPSGLAAKLRFPNQRLVRPAVVMEDLVEIGEIENLPADIALFLFGRGLRILFGV
jgi:hypothetical protein